MVTPAIVSADYYVSDYDPDYAPYNLQEVIDTLEYDSCREEVKAFDTVYNEYLQLYGTPISVGGILDVNFGALKESTEEEFRQCSVVLRREMQEESISACDFAVIESLTREDERSFKTEIKECKDLRALNECNFEYLEEMDGSDMFTYRKEIDVCEATVKLEVTDTRPPEVVLEPKAVELIPEFIPVITEPVDVPPIAPAFSPSPVIEKPQNQQSVEQDPQPEAATTTEAETFVMTQEEIDALVTQRLAESESAEASELEPEPVNSPNVFKRIWSFLTSWL